MSCCYVIIRWVVASLVEGIMRNFSERVRKKGGRESFLFRLSVIESRAKIIYKGENIAKWREGNRVRIRQAFVFIRTCRLKNGRRWGSLRHSSLDFTFCSTTESLSRLATFSSQLRPLVPLAQKLSPRWCLFPVNIIMGRYFPHVERFRHCSALSVPYLVEPRPSLYATSISRLIFFQTFHSSFSFENGNFFLFLEHYGEGFCFYFGRRMLTMDFSFFCWGMGEEWNETTTLWKWILPSAE